MQEKIILDYGCGWGGNCKFIANRGKYIGIDIDPKMIEFAQKKYNGQFRTGNGTEIPLPDKYCDEVHCYDVLEHVKNLEKILNELNRVLKENGKMFIVVPAEISERVLLKLKPDYFKDVGHERIVNPIELQETLIKKNIHLVTCKKVRGMEAVVYAYLFAREKNNRYMEYQSGSPQFSKLLVAWIWLFDSRLFITPLKYLFFIYIFTLPIGWCISRFFPKSIYMVFEKRVI